jgi:ligand-binding SRPBCC domain-containing protein
MGVRRLAKGARPGGDPMPRFERTETYPAPPARAFALFRRPAERVRMTPPELRLELEDGPEELALGSRMTVRGRRWGVTQRMTTEVTALEDGVRIVEEQRQGPFRSWKHTQRFDATPDGGVRITDEIDFEPPGGVLGRLATAEAIRAELEAAFAYRARRLTRLLPPAG